MCFLYGNGNFASFTVHDSDDCDLEQEDRRTKRKRLFNKYVIYLFTGEGDLHHPNWLKVVFRACRKAIDSVKVAW